MGAKGKMLALEISPKVIRAIEYVPETSPLEGGLAAAYLIPSGGFSGSSCRAGDSPRGER